MNGPQNVAGTGARSSGFTTSSTSSAPSTPPTSRLKRASSTPPIVSLSTRTISVVEIEKLENEIKLMRNSLQKKNVELSDAYDVIDDQGLKLKRKQKELYEALHLLDEQNDILQEKHRDLQEAYFKLDKQGRQLQAMNDELHRNQVKQELVDHYGQAALMQQENNKELAETIKDLNKTIASLKQDKANTEIELIFIKSMVALASAYYVYSNPEMVAEIQEMVLSLIYNWKPEMDISSLEALMQSFPIIPVMAGVSAYAVEVIAFRMLKYAVLYTTLKYSRSMTYSILESCKLRMSYAISKVRENPLSIGSKAKDLCRNIIRLACVWYGTSLGILLISLLAYYNIYAKEVISE